MLFQQKVRDGYDYEVYVANVLKRQGFHKIEFTAKTGDYGVDLLASRDGSRYAIQCKYYTGAVGGFAVQQAVAGMAYYGCERAMVVTNSRLTKGALKLAEANDVEVLEYIDPERLTFWERRKPWELALLAAECVVFGLALNQMAAQAILSWKGAGVLALLCFPLPFLLLWIGRAVVKLCR